MKIGIVEDNPSIGGLLCTTLELLGHHPSLYYDGWSFFEQFLSETPTAFDMVLVDLVLPSEIPGIQVITTVRKHRPFLPIIVVSAVDILELNNIQIHYPGVLTLRKPFSIHDLHACLTQAAVKSLFREYTILRA